MLLPHYISDYLSSIQLQMAILGSLLIGEGTVDMVSWRLCLQDDQSRMATLFRPQMVIVIGLVGDIQECRY